jgi:hypothetical protein
MSLSTISIGSVSYTLVSTPFSNPGLSDIEFTYVDGTAVSRSLFTGQSEIQQWPGSDYIKGTITWPPLTAAQARQIEAFLGELRGNVNVFQFGDPRPQSGTGTGSAIVSSTTAAMATTISTGGWTASPSVGDWLQIQYRLYRIANINSYSGGAGVFEVYPSVRESIPSSTAVTYSNPKGLFRLATGERTINWSPSRLTTLSLQFIEAR